MLSLFAGDRFHPADASGGLLTPHFLLTVCITNWFPPLPSHFLHLILCPPLPSSSSHSSPSGQQRVRRSSRETTRTNASDGRPHVSPNNSTRYNSNSNTGTSSVKKSPSRGSAASTKSNSSSSSMQSAASAGTGVNSGKTRV